MHALQPNSIECNPIHIYDPPLWILKTSWHYSYTTCVKPYSYTNGPKDRWLLRRSREEQLAEANTWCASRDAQKATIVSLITVESDAAQTAIVWLLSPMPLKQPLPDYCWVQCRSNSHCLIIVESNAAQTAIVWLLSPMCCSNSHRLINESNAAQTAIVWLFLSPMPLKQPSSDYCWVRCRSNSHRLFSVGTHNMEKTPHSGTSNTPPTHTHTISSCSRDLISVRSHFSCLHHTALTLSVSVPTFLPFIIQPWPYQCPFPRSIPSSCSLDLISVRSHVSSLNSSCSLDLISVRSHVPSLRHAALTLSVSVPTFPHFVIQPWPHYCTFLHFVIQTWPYQCPFPHALTSSDTFHWKHTRRWESATLPAPAPPPPSSPPSPPPRPGSLPFWRPRLRGVVAKQSMSILLFPPSVGLLSSGGESSLLAPPEAVDEGVEDEVDGVLVDDRHVCRVAVPQRVLHGQQEGVLDQLQHAHRVTMSVQIPPQNLPVCPTTARAEGYGVCSNPASKPSCVPNYSTRRGLRCVFKSRLKTFLCAQLQHAQRVTVCVQIPPQDFPVCPNLPVAFSILSEKKVACLCVWLVEWRRMYLDKDRAGREGTRCVCVCVCVCVCEDYNGKLQYLTFCLLKK